MIQGILGGKTMSLTMKTDKGTVTISVQALQTLAGTIASESYGVVGMASQHMLRDGLAEILGQENFKKGITITENDGNVEIDLYVVIAYGVKVVEVVKSIQNKIEYEIEKMFGVQVRSVNVFVQEIRVIDK